MNTELSALFFSVAFAHFVALLSPGPDFALIVNSGLRNPLCRALGTAAGIGAANAAYIALCLVGVGSAIAAHPALLVAVRVGGGAYLLYLGFRALTTRAGTGKAEFSGALRSGSFASEFLRSFPASALNPKLPLFYLGLFALALGPGVSFGFRVALGLWMASVVFIWDAFILFVLTRSRLRESFLAKERILDRVAGIAFICLGFAALVSGFL